MASLAGSNLRLRFRIASDNGVASLGWWIDNLSVFSCSTAISIAITPLDAAVVTAVGKSATLSLTLPSAPTQNVVVPVTVSKSAVASVAYVYAC